MAKSWRHSLLPILLAGVVVGLSTPAWADHSLGRPCLECHQLRSTNVESGTRNIKRDLIAGSFPYAANWYCSGLTSSANPRAPLDGVFQGGNPLDCSYCHQSIGNEFLDATNRVQKPTPELTASAHPVDTLGATYSWVGRRIACNQCHSAEVTAESTTAKELCVKTPSVATGYPNHLNLSTVTAPTGSNQRVGPAAHLRTEYGPTAGSDWTTTAGILCFECHISGGTSDIDMKAEYDSVRGGHNILGIGSLAAKKLPCYNCHDPHAVSNNAKLIIELKGTKIPAGKHNPYETSYVTGDPPSGFDGTNDRAVCAGCHGGGYVVEGVSLPDVFAAAWVPSAFPFHADAHTGLAAAGNCLQNNGGCHQSPHNTDVYRCLDCHSKAVTDLIPPAVTEPARLVAVNHTDSEFGHIGAIGPNKIQSVHTIPYAATVWLPGQSFPAADAALDMSQPANNGCLYCHNAVGQAANTIVVGDGGPALTGSRGNDFTGARENLSHFDAFCLSCHDGGGPTFTVGSYTLSDASSTGSNVNFSGGELYPPQVNNKTGVGDGYFYTAGHGRGLLGSPSTAYPPASGTPSPNSNPGAEIPCLECHVYHGSTAYKLLPGWRESSDGTAHVLKGGGYPPRLSTGVESTSTLNPIGDATNSAVIDYTDYSNPNYARAESDYQVTDYWSSYAHTNTPSGKPTPFGSSGDLFNGAIACNQDTANLSTPSGAGRTNGTKEIGFCNMCHFFDDGTSAPTDGTTTTYSLAYSHRGDPALVDCDGLSLGSKRTFWRDCLECHDPHGSGTDSSTGTANLYMVRARMKVDASTWTNVTFTSRGKDAPLDAGVTANSFDADDVNNADDICNVCHTGLDWSNRTAGPNNSHMNGYRCTKCHRHGM